MKNLFAISGKIGTGKDLTAKIIQYLLIEDNLFNASYDDIIRNISRYEINNSEYRVKKFAGKLKDRIALTWNIPRKNLEKQEFKNSLCPLGITWRRLMQLEGEKMREIHEDYWVNAEFSEYNGKNSKWIFTDLRYPNEYNKIVMNNGLTIRLNLDEEKSLEKNEVNSHHSETGLDNTTHHYHIINKKTSYKNLINPIKNILLENINYT